MPFKRLLLLTGTLSFLFFVSLSYFVHQGLLRQFDFDTTVKLQDSITIQFDTFLSSLSFVGSFEVITLLVFVILTFRKSFIIFFSYAFLHVVELFGKFFVTQIGPPLSFLRTELPFTIPSSYVAPGYSYPSGHSARTIFITAILLFFTFKSKRLSKEQKILITLLIVLLDSIMLVSRVSLGEHWTTDTIGGALLGLSLGLLTLILI